MTCTHWRVLFVFMSVHVNAVAQSDSSFIFTAYHNAIDLYPSGVEYQSVLYNGSEYKEPKQTEQDHPFYVTDEWQEASIVYDGIRFNEVDAIYELYTDELVIEHKNGTPIRLVKPKVSEFTIGRRRFVHVIQRDSMASLPKSSFYQVVHAGPSICLARWTKGRTEIISQSKVEIWFRQRVFFYVYKNGLFNPVQSRGSLMRLLADQKQKVRRYMTKEKIKFGADREMALTKVLSFYDSLPDE
jgi:hypothetical protein